MSKTKIGAWLWIISLQYFLAEAVSILAWPSSYSLTRNYISDLGAVRCDNLETGREIDGLCSPLHGVMNSSFLIQGFLIACGALLVSPLFRRGVLWVVALFLVAASGFGVFLVGLSPEDTAPTLHFLGASENFVCCNAGMAMMGVAMLRRRGAARNLGLVTFGVGVFGLTALGLFTIGVFLGLGPGGMERLVAYPFPLWLASMGVLLSRSSSRGFADRLSGENT